MPFSKWQTETLPQTSFAACVLVGGLGQLDARTFQPLAKLGKGQNGIDSFILGCLVFFGDAGADEYGLDAAHTALHIQTVSLSGGDNGRKSKQSVGVMLAHQQVDAGAAGGDKHVGLVLAENALVLGLDDGSAHRGLLDTLKSQLAQRVAHGGDAHAGERRNKRRGNADVYLLGGQHDLDVLYVVFDLLGILGTDLKALTAQDAFVLNNVCLTCRELDSLDGAVTDALVTVFTVAFFES